MAKSRPTALIVVNSYATIRIFDSSGYLGDVDRERASKLERNIADLHRAC